MSLSVKLTMIFLTLAIIPVVGIGLSIYSSVDTMSEQSQDNTQELGDDVTNIAENALHSEGKYYMLNTMNQTVDKIADYFSEREADSITLSNITKSNNGFLAFALSKQIYAKVAYVNASGYENITIENNKITTNYTDVSNTSYFGNTTNVAIVPYGEAYVDYSELMDTTAKHVFRFSAKTGTAP